LPGLKAVAEAWLHVVLDKEEQCSDWDRRPLSEQQLHYAAADAAVLLSIAEAMAMGV
jgi:ribonuclease D